MQKGKNNREIASALGIRVELVRRWRPMAAIPQPGPDRALGERLLREGKSRREVMLLTGASQGTVTQWRKALGLSQRVHPARERAMALLRQGLSCAAVHRATGVTIVTISLWRAELRGTASRRSAPSRSDPRRALVDAMLHAGKNNAEIAAAVGVSRPTVARWRRELGLLYRHPRSAPTERL
jgi:transposase